VLAITSWCNDLRLSTIEKNGNNAKSTQPLSTTKSRSCDSMRTDKGVGSSGTTTASAARSTFSESREIPGGQSRNSAAYEFRSERLIFNRRSVGCLRSLRCTSKLR